MSGMTKTEAVQYAAEHGYRFVAYIPDEYSWATIEGFEDLEAVTRLYGVKQIEALSPERWVTTAPESLDYGYTHTVGEVELHGKTMRVVAVTDPWRFEQFQRPRYASGFYSCIQYKGGE